LNFLNLYIVDAANGDFVRAIMSQVLTFSPTPCSPHHPPNVLPAVWITSKHLAQWRSVMEIYVCILFSIDTDFFDTDTTFDI